MLSRFIQRHDHYQPALFWFAVFTLCWTLVLLYAGAYTTSISAGMVFLDWPLSNSSIMPEGWWQNQDMRAEHSHRLLATTLGYLAIILSIWAFLRVDRKRVRQLAYGLLALVVAQGLLGGLRVLYDKLNTGAETNVAGYTFRILHALGAEFTLCALAALALVLSRRWKERQCNLQSPVPSSVRSWGIAAVLALVIQITLGALMRHAGAGLAIPTFPLTPEGGVLPAVWSTPVALHWLHRLGAVIATIAILGFLGMLYGRSNTRRALLGSIIGVIMLLALQIFLGAATVWTYKNPVMASTHMLVGALLLASVWTLTLQTFRLPKGSQELTNRRLPSTKQAQTTT
ncbi:COX15/CtaA family protein [Cerasicoccus arenae]|uniref:Cytochrome aa3 oxidase assembly protein CtaA n=1 Tax=Cerasicoccus arenae TaxID=424488 RepID=A0A8J3DA20_9BACT|nr:COX15/CtaA family protein [Cerasicoccus arenae]MBK1857511.1 COX15/CtaA family protein [Cerasicoccus arenae]GHB95438.1 cytochrome aa3 oxidase assembly protein CtaA [Cerasicoccus arenae]